MGLIQSCIPCFPRSKTKKHRHRQPVEISHPFALQPKVPQVPQAQNGRQTPQSRTGTKHRSKRHTGGAGTSTVAYPGSARPLFAGSSTTSSPVKNPRGESATSTPGEIKYPTTVSSPAVRHANSPRIGLGIGVYDDEDEDDGDRMIANGGLVGGSMQRKWTYGMTTESQSVRAKGEPPLRLTGEFGTLQTDRGGHGHGHGRIGTIEVKDGPSTFPQRHPRTDRPSSSYSMLPPLDPISPLSSNLEVWRTAAAGSSTPARPLSLTLEELNARLGEVVPAASEDSGAGAGAGWSAGPSRARITPPDLDIPGPDGPTSSPLPDSTLISTSQTPTVRAYNGPGDTSPQSQTTLRPHHLRSLLGPRYPPSALTHTGGSNTAYPSPITSFRSNPITGSVTSTSARSGRSQNKLRKALKVEGGWELVRQGDWNGSGGAEGDGMSSRDLEGTERGRSAVTTPDQAHLGN